MIIIILAGIVGWCGTGVPRTIFVGGGGVLDPDWPPNCLVCNRVVGALAGILTVYALGSHFADAGLLGTMALAFFGGNFGSSLVSGIGRMASRG